MPRRLRLGRRELRLHPRRERRLPGLPRARLRLREGRGRDAGEGRGPGGRGTLGGHARARELPHLPRLRRRRPGGEARRPRLVAGPPARRGGRPHGQARLPLHRLPRRARITSCAAGPSRSASRTRTASPAPTATPARCTTTPASRRHLRSVACQTCHVPTFARKIPTKACWDWSKAGDPKRKEDPHHYLKIKGEFVYEQDAVPEYRWFDLHRRIATCWATGSTPPRSRDINPPRGSIDEPEGADLALQDPPRPSSPTTPCNLTLFPPVTGGTDGYWTTFDWDSAFRLGSKTSGLPYSGKYGFAQHRDVLAAHAHGRAQGEGARLHRLPRGGDAARLEGPRLPGRSHPDRRPAVSRLAEARGLVLLALLAVARRPRRRSRPPNPIHPLFAPLDAAGRPVRPARGRLRRRRPAAPATTPRYIAAHSEHARAGVAGDLRPVSRGRRPALGATPPGWTGGKLRREDVRIGTPRDRQLRRLPRARLRRRRAGRAMPADLRGARPRPAAGPGRSPRARGPSSRPSG